MTERPVDEIRPGDRVYLSAGDAKGSILQIKRLDLDGASWITTFDVTVALSDKPLRILQPGDVIPAGATYALVQADGKITNGRTVGGVGLSTHAIPERHFVLLSMPEPKPSREEQRAKLVEACRREQRSLRAGDGSLPTPLPASEIVRCARRIVEAADALAKFDAENPS